MLERIPCIRLPRLKFELTYQDSAGEKKLYCPKFNVSLREKHWGWAIFSVGTASNTQEKEFIIPKPYYIIKVENYGTLWTSKVLICKFWPPHGSRAQLPYARLALSLMELCSGCFPPGELPLIRDRVSRRKFWKESLRSTKILFCGLGLRCFHPQEYQY